VPLHPMLLTRRNAAVLNELAALPCNAGRIRQLWKIPSRREGSKETVTIIGGEFCCPTKTLDDESDSLTAGASLTGASLTAQRYSTL